MSDVVLSSRIRLARNLADRPFLVSASQAERTQIYRTLVEEITQTPAGASAMIFDIDDLDPIDRRILVERHLISHQHACGEGSRGVTISPDETQSLMINEEDHLRIQGLRSGLQLEAIWEDISAIDDAVSSRVAIAFDKNLG